MHKFISDLIESEKFSAENLCDFLAWLDETPHPYTDALEAVEKVAEFDIKCREALRLLPFHS